MIGEYTCQCSTLAIFPQHKCPSQVSLSYWHPELGNAQLAAFVQTSSIVTKVKGTPHLMRKILILNLQSSIAEDDSSRLGEATEAPSCVRRSCNENRSIAAWGHDVLSAMIIKLVVLHVVEMNGRESI